VAAPIPLLAPVTTATRRTLDGLEEGWLMEAILVAHSSLVTPRTLVRLAGLLGGLCWIARAVLDDGEGPGSLIDALHYGGAALLAIALLGIGAGLVSGLAALRLVVAVCLLALGWAVLEFLHDQYADRGVDGVAGALVAAYCLAGLLRRRRPRGGGRAPRPRRSSGSHAA
jgi:hypothetical protein